MAALNFPTSPTVNQTYTANGFTWQWDGTSWKSAGGSFVSSFSGGTTGLTPATGTTGAVTLAGTLNIANGGTGAGDAATARSNLGLAIGTNVQAYSANLATIAGLSPTNDNFIVGNGTSWTIETPAQVRTSLGLVIGTNVQAWDADLDAIAALAGTTGLLRKTAANTWSLDTNTYLTGNQTITVSGDATGSGATAISLTLASVGTSGTYTKVTTDAKGRVTSGTTLTSADLPTYTGTLTSSQITTGLGYTPYNSTNPNGYISASGSITGASGSVTVADSRNAVTTPQTIGQGVVFDFKANTTEGLSDGGTYFGEMTFRPYGNATDWTGGLSHQLGFTDNGNVWQRAGSSTTWGSWKKLLDSSNFNSYAPTLTGTGASGTWGINITGSAASITGTYSGSLTSSQVTTALGYTPYNSTNPNGYITSSGSISGNAATATNISNTGTVTLASATESNSIYITAPSYSTDTPVKLLNFDWYGNLFSLGNIRSGATPTNGFGVYYTASGGSRTEIARFGTNGSFNAVGAITQNGNQILHAGNYNSYTPTLTGGGASGTWGISVTGSAGSVPWSGVTSKPASIMYYQGFTLDANTMDSNATGFTYSVNAPYTGPVARFSTGGGYDLWLNAPYNEGGNGLAFRTRNGDAGTLNSWKYVLHDGNYNTYSPTLTGGGASGTWGISITGSAASITGTYSGSLTSSQVTTALGYTPANAAGQVFTGDITTYRPGSPTTGVIYLGNNSGTKYLYFDGTNYSMPGGQLDVNGSRVLNAGNYNSYAPTLTGTGASGTWSINVTGSAGSASTATNATNATNTAITDDTTTNATHYVTVVSGTSGNLPQKVSSTKLTFNPSTGDFTAAGNVTAYSDERLKTGWSDLRADFLESLAGVKHGTYTRIDSGERQAGASAQAMREVLPEVVFGDDKLSLAYGNAALVAAIQLAKRVVEQEARILKLERAIEAMR